MEPALPRSRPISEVVSDAFHHSPATNQVSPEIISMISAQVTEQVMKNIAQQQQATSSVSTASMTSGSPQTTYPPPPRSPTQESTGSTHQIFTPPTPELYQASVEDADSPSPPPEIIPSDLGSQLDRQSREGTRSEEMPRPVKPSSESTIRKQSPSKTGSGIEREGVEAEQMAQDPEQRRKDSISSQTAYDSRPRHSERPTEEPPDNGETPLERTWQPLFINGDPTPRLGQFLRGIARCLIDDYEPKCSLVVTPYKMLRFFNETRVTDEHYPWDIIFGGKMAPGSVSMMYRKLLCEHHLIQFNRQDQPNVPGLTPHGFECFLTCLIQAHPDKEFERLARAVMKMPISNSDDKTERFPKELPRRLLPSQGNIQAEQRLVSSLNHEPYVLGEVRGATAMPPPPPPLQRQPQSSFNERERQPYSQASQYSNALDDDDLNSPAFQMERERKPYTAMEGSGRVYGADDSRTLPSQGMPELSGTRPTRTNSAAPSQPMYPPSSGPSDPMNIPPRMPQRTSFNQNNTFNTPPPGMNGRGPKPVHRRSSPPPRNPHTRSGELSEAGSMPNQQFGSNLHPAQSTPANFESEEDRFARMSGRYRADRSSANNNTMYDETNTSGARTINRSTPSVNDYQYGGMGGPVGGPPPAMSNSYSSRPGPPPSHPMDERRRQSMYAAPSGFQGGGDGGTDGYGSFAGGMNSRYAPPPQQPPPYGSSTQH